MPIAPVPYTADVEFPEPDEADIIGELVDTLRKISEITFRDEAHALRSVHAKSHGFLHGRLRVLPGLVPELAQGLFAMPVAHPAVLRLSTTPGDLLDDSVSTPRGLALKVLDVDGERVSGSERDRTQDFVLVNGPAFLAPDVKHFLRSLKLLAATTDKVPNLKKALSAALRGVEKVVETVGGESGALKGLGGHPETHILGETFYSQAPILYGSYMAKVAVVPVSPDLRALTGSPLNVNGHPNGLRDAVADFFSVRTGEWDVRVQLCVDLATMPIEDSSIRWPEEASPYQTVARLTVPPQHVQTGGTANLVGDGYAFSPWHALAAHRPLGSIMRARKVAYAMSSRFRRERNRQALVEPSA
jgi:hypothetical protein